MVSNLTAALKKLGISVPDHSENDITPLVALKSALEHQIAVNGHLTQESAPEQMKQPNQEPQAETSAAPPAQNHSQQAALKEFEHAFPYGYEIMATSAEGLLCGWHSVILSMSAQYPNLPCPTREELQDIFDSMKDEFAEVYDMANSNNFSIDQVAYVLYVWGMSHGLNLRIGYQEEGEAPLLVSHPNDDEDVTTLWVHNDGRYQFSIGHFSGMKPRSAEQYIIAESAQPATETLLGQYFEGLVS